MGMAAGKESKCMARLCGVRQANVKYQWPSIPSLLPDAAIPPVRHFLGGTITGPQQLAGSIQTKGRSLSSTGVDVHQTRQTAFSGL